MKHLPYASIIRHLILFCVCMFTGIPFSQNAYSENNDSVSYLAEVRATFSSGENTPFWLVNNLQGLGSPEKNNGWVRGAVFKKIDTQRKFSWGAGLDLVGGWNAIAPFNVHQLYGEVKYRSLGLLLGSKEIWGDYNNPRLSSGNLLYSGNAMPIPQLRIGIFDYAPFWGTNGWFSVKGYVSYGMFTDSKWQKSWAAPDTKRTEGVLFHSKGLWLRGGNTDKFPLTGEIGIEMASQFGGESFKDGEVIRMPSKFKDWLKALFPVGGDNSTPIDEQINVQGNMLGAYNFALSWVPKEDWSIKAYFEHYFEDHSQMTFEYGWKDGLWGIEVQLPKNPIVSTFVYEYLNSKDQTGSVFNNTSESIPEQVSGRDFYYDHYIYSGWEHWGMGIGNPLAISPIYNKNHLIAFLDTRLTAHHFGIAGNPSKEFDYRILMSFSRNWGSYGKPYPEVLNNFNGLLEVCYKPHKLKGWKASLGVAMDGGQLLGKSFGVMLTIGKSGFINF